MPTYDETRWWEREDEVSPREERFDAQPKRPPQEGGRSFTERLKERERRRARSSVPTPEPPRAA